MPLKNIALTFVCLLPVPTVLHALMSTRRGSLLVCCQSDTAIDTASLSLCWLHSFYQSFSLFLLASYLLSFVMSPSLSESPLQRAAVRVYVRDLIRHVHHLATSMSSLLSYLRAILICSNESHLLLSFQTLLFSCLCTDCLMSNSLVAIRLER